MGSEKDLEYLVCSTLSTTKLGHSAGHNEPVVTMLQDKDLKSHGIL